MFNWLSVVIGFFYVVLGITVVVYHFFVVPLEPSVSYPLGGLLMIYGIFRIVRAILKIKKSKNEE